MKGRVGRCVSRPTTNIFLQVGIREEWDALTSNEISSMVDCMPHQIAAVMTLSGGHTCY